MTLLPPLQNDEHSSGAEPVLALGILALSTREAAGERLSGGGGGGGLRAILCIGGGGAFGGGDIAAVPVAARTPGGGGGKVVAPLEMGGCGVVRFGVGGGGGTTCNAVAARCVCVGGVLQDCSVSLPSTAREEAKWEYPPRE